MDPLINMTDYLHQIAIHPQFNNYDWDLIIQTYMTTLMILYTTTNLFAQFSPKAAFEYVRMMFYTYWSFASLFFTYQLMVNEDISYFNDYFVYSMHTMNCVHAYELLLYTPDLGHCIHHILVIIIQSFGYHNGTLINGARYLYGASSHLGMISSIFSSMRVIARIEQWRLKSVLDTIYYWSYLFCKIGGIVFAYWAAYRYDILHDSSSDLHVVFVLYGIMHMIQLYFCNIIITKLKMCE
jgi:hypothetical protein